MGNGRAPVRIAGIISQEAIDWFQGVGILLESRTEQTSTFSHTPTVIEITTTVTRHFSSFGQYNPWKLSRDIFESLFSFTKVNSFLSD